MLLLLAVAGIGVTVWYAHRSTQFKPKFYQAALEIDPKIYEEAGEEFENQLLQLNTDVRNQTEWQASFSNNQVNGWLAFELPEKFPGTVPHEVSEPRVAFLPDEVQLAFRFVSRHWSGVVTASGTVFCTDQHNQIGIQVRQLRSGMIPLPISQWSEQIAAGCAKSGINLTWSQKDGDTVAIVDLPEKFLDIRDRQITLCNIVIEENRLIMSGTSEPSRGPRISQSLPLPGSGVSDKNHGSESGDFGIKNQP